MGDFEFTYPLVTGEEVVVTVHEGPCQFLEIGITTPLSQDPGRLTAIATAAMPKILIEAAERWGARRMETIASRKEVTA